ncbi:MAG: histidinol-phosphate transaminase [Paludibacteraceae bacterium]|nr:histidinol-phosphate transaminase [Paludibacteraceae bacterium]
MGKTLEQLVRNNIRNLAPYSCARDEFKGEARVYLDANENPLNAPYNRYPDPLQLSLKEKISRIKGVKVPQIMLGNGSDEPIDLVYRVFCEPKVDNAVAIAPTYGMYGVCADVNDVEYRSVLLEDDFSLNADKVLAAVDEHTKVIFLCSPNNPTGNLLNSSEIEKILRSFDGITVIDEAYIDFASNESWTKRLAEFPNMIVLHTFSKAWGLAAVRCGMAFASEEIISYFNKVKYPYNVNALTQNLVSDSIDKIEQKEAWVKMILEERERVSNELKGYPCVLDVYPSDANFVLVKTNDAQGIYAKLVDEGIIVRNRNSVVLCGGCLRITIGTRQENDELLKILVTCR